MLKLLLLVLFHKVTGLPEPRKDHAVVMARFARDCLHKMNRLTKQLEVELGPDTSDLCMRIGLHSGPVTAGVLRGEKSRFQLFGDTMNTTARTETTGSPNRIHLSKDTANLLIEAGKSNWVTPREEKVVAKGKGMFLETVSTKPCLVVYVSHFHSLLRLQRRDGDVLAECPGLGWYVRTLRD